MHLPARPYVVTALVARRGRCGGAADLLGHPPARSRAVRCCFRCRRRARVLSVGVEEHWWSGIAGCEGTVPSTLRIEDLQAELAQPSGLRACDEDVWRLFGLSLALQRGG